MEDKLKSAFDKVRAEDALKEKTASFLRAQIQKRSPARRTSRLRLAAVCASFVLLLLMGGFSYNLYFTPTAYVDLDINPSVELAVNRFGRVLDATPYDDGIAILQDVHIRHKAYGEAVEILLDAMIEQGYLQQEGLVSLTVQTQDSETEKSLLNSLQPVVLSSLASHHAKAEVEVFPVTQDVRICAYGYGMSPAKYLAIRQLQEVDPTATFEGCAGHSISELRQLAGEHNGRRRGATSFENHESEETSSQSSDRENSSAPAARHRGNDRHRGSGHE